MQPQVYFQEKAITALQKIVNSYDAVFVLCDTNTQNYCLPLLESMNKKSPFNHILTCYHANDVPTLLQTTDICNYTI